MSDSLAWAAEREAYEEHLRALGRCVVCERKKCAHLTRERNQEALESLNKDIRELEEIKNRIPVLESRIDWQKSILKKRRVKVSK